MSVDLYALVTDQIIAALRAGVVPWRKPWHDLGTTPANAISKRPYRGVNTLLLGLTPYRDHRWLTFKQAQELGGSVRAGERSATAIFWKRWDVPQGPEVPERLAPRSIPLLRYFRVIHVMQCDGLSLPPLPEPDPGRFLARIDRAEAFLSKMPDPSTIRDDCRSAWYRPADDVVGMPNLRTFESADAYYSTLLHEYGHSTGHEKRLSRPGVTGVVQFGSSDYGREELVAELTSAFCCRSIGLDGSLIDNSASYIDNWLAALKGDPKAIVIAAAQAQKAADLISGNQFEEG